MIPRASWKGYIRLSLVSVPVQAFSAMASGGGEIHLHQLHKTCHSRVRYQKVCPLHGELDKKDIVTGYEYAKGQYVIIDPDEVDKLRTEGDKAISIDTFVEPSEVDPMYFEGRSYYLVPDGHVGQKPYSVLRQAMVEKKRWAVGQAVFSGREQLVLLRPLDDLLSISMLHYESQLRQPGTLNDDVAAGHISKEELRLAEMLIDASSSDSLDLSVYRDRYTERMTELIEAKVAGRQIVEPPAEKEAAVINLMDALRRSVARAKDESGGPSRTKAKPRAKPAKTGRRPPKHVA